MAITSETLAKLAKFDTPTICNVIELFDVRYLDPVSGMWNETWDSAQAIGQPGRLPLQIKITLILKGGIGNKPVTFTTKIPIAMQTALNFAVPRGN